MSFSSDTKRELCKIENKNKCCNKAEGYGLLLFSKCFTPFHKKINIESIHTASIIAQYASTEAGAIVDISGKVNRSKGDTYTLTIVGDGSRKSIYDVFGHDLHEVQLRINSKNIKCEKCKSAFLRGAFISAGSITDPQKEYHLEFVVPHKLLAGDLLAMLNDEAMNFQASLTERGGNYIVYIKDSSKIEDMLTFIGAMNSSMELMQVKMYKEAMNDINRKSNFETANMDKTFSASAKQTAAIAIISDTVGLASLSEELQQMASLRLENPDMSLKQLSEVLGISRSGVNHRIKRLIEIAEKCAGGNLEEWMAKSLNE